MTTSLQYGRAVLKSANIIYTTNQNSLICQILLKYYTAPTVSKIDIVDANCDQATTDLLSLAVYNQLTNCLNISVDVI